MIDPCHIVGVLDNGAAGLTPEALARVREARVVIGGTRLLGLLAAEIAPAAATLDLTGRLGEVPGWIEQARASGHRVVVLATGDPLCHGIGAWLAGRLPAGSWAVLPNLSTVQLACARLGLPWHDLPMLSVHRQDGGEWNPGAGPEHGLHPLLQALQRLDRLAVLTSPANSPDRIARMLVAEGLERDWRLTVAERLLREDERILADLTAMAAAGQRFAEPNVLLLRRDARHCDGQGPDAQDPDAQAPDARGPDAQTGPDAVPARPGRLFGVSLGPGDPRLITRRAWGLLQRRDTHWAYPVSGSARQSFALEIARAAGLAVPSSSFALSFPMTHDQARLAAAWSLAAERVLGVLRGGTDVLFLVEGDASTYASFGHLAQAVAEQAPDIAIETIPGVTSFAASAARLGIPLVDRDERLAVLPAGYGIDAMDRLLDEHDTLVLLKVKPILDDVLTLLERRGLLAHAAFVEKAGTRAERLVRDVAGLRGQEVNYLSLLLVKNPRRGRAPMVPSPAQQTGPAAGRGTR